MPFKVGDEVIVHKPNNPDEFPTWVDDMDEYDCVDSYYNNLKETLSLDNASSTGKVVKIRTIYGDAFGVYGTTFTFSPNWIDYPASEELDDIEPDMSELM